MRPGKCQLGHEKGLETPSTDPGKGSESRMPALSRERKESNPGKVKRPHESRLEGGNSPEKLTKITATPTHTKWPGTRNPGRNKHEIPTRDLRPKWL